MDVWRSRRLTVRFSCGRLWTFYVVCFLWCVLVAIYIDDGDVSGPDAGISGWFVQPRASL